jgi:RNA polymerase sigma factor (sigma-70 family)
VTTTSTRAAPRGDEAELYRRHHRKLQHAVARVVNAPRELIEDACQTAWTILLRSQPDRRAIFTWLRVVAIHEAYRLAAADRGAHLEDLDHSEGWDAVVAHRVTIDDTLEARRALRRLAELPERQRRDLSLRVAGFSYREIAQLTGGRTYTNVNEHLGKARARIRSAELQAAEGEGPCRRSSSSLRV